MPLKPKWLQLAYGNRANAYLMKGDNDEALDSYDKAIALDADYTAAYTGRGLIYEKLGLIEKARADFQAALNAHSPFHDDDWGRDTAREHLERMHDK